MRAFLAVVRNEVTQILRDKLYLLLMTVGAMGTLITMAYTLSTDIEGVTTAVVDLDRDQHSRELIQRLANEPFFAPQMVESRAAADLALREGTVNIVLLIPSGYSQSIARQDPVRLQVIIDGSEPGIAELASNRFLAVTNDISQQLIVEQTARSGLEVAVPLELRLRVLYNPETKMIVSVVPGLMAIVLTVPAVGAAAAFARERERGSFELVVSTPLGRWPLLLGRVAPYIVIGLFDIGIFTAVGYLAFDVPLRGDLGLFVLLGLVYVFATASSGVLIAQFLNTQHSAVITTFMLFGITPVYLADIFFPVVTMPGWLQSLSALLPATHFTIIARGVFLKGVGLRALWPNGLVLLAVGGAMSLLAYMRFRKKLAW